MPGLAQGVNLKHLHKPFEEGADAVFVFADFVNNKYRSAIINTVLTHRFPCMAQAPFYVENGCLLFYFTDWLELRRRAAVYVDKILRGTKPADLPVEEPTKFQLIVNLKTAEALGLTIPQSVLALADKVIE